VNELQLIEAVKAANVTLVKTLIDSGANVNQQDEQGWTPLNWAAGKGDLELVSLLIENGADVFKTGRDLRTPYLIALAAGHAEVVKYLREVESRHPGNKPIRPERQYCKAYYLKDLRKFSGWFENKINLKEESARPNPEDGNGAILSDEDVVFVHQDYSVTHSMWQNEDVIYNKITPEWQKFCSDSLRFKTPDDLDLIVPSKQADKSEAV